MRYSSAMKSISPLKFAAWCALAGISFGAALGWGALIVAGMLLPIFFLLVWIIVSELRS